MIKKRYNNPSKYLSMLTKLDSYVKFQNKIDHFIKLIDACVPEIYEMDRDIEKILEIARMLKEDFLQQNAFHDVDSFCNMKKQYLMLKTILRYYDKARNLYHKGADGKEIFEQSSTISIARMKYIEQSEIETKITELITEIDGLTPRDFGVEEEY